MAQITELLDRFPLTAEERAEVIEYYTNVIDALTPCPARYNKVREDAIER